MVVGHERVSSGTGHASRIHEHDDPDQNAGTAARQGKTRNRTTAVPVALLADSELLNHSLVALGVVLFEVVEQATPLADHHEKAATRRVVLLVSLEVLVELADALGEQSYLNLGTTRVGRVGAIAADNGLFPLSR